jgi:predicted lipoprotein with Yx(FWY)xxD motif
MVQADSEEFSMRTSGIRFVVVAAVATFALAACSSSDKTASPSTNPTTTTVETTTTAGQTPTSPAAAGATTVALASSDLGQILVDGKGMTLYLDEKDKPGAPACTGGCLVAWPPVPAPDTFTGGPGVDGTKFGDTTASDGSKQLTVNGSPLYTFMSDKKPGDVTGQDVNGFYVVGKDYKKIEDAGS